MKTVGDVVIGNLSPEHTHSGNVSSALARQAIGKMKTGIERDCNLSKVAYLQSTTGVVNVGRKKYRDLKNNVQRAVAAYGSSDTLTYLRAIAHLSHA